MTLYKIQELINAEGAIVTILMDENESIFIMGNTENGKKKIIAKTNHFQLALYLKSRITLKELFLLNQDEHYYILSRLKKDAVFFELTTVNLPKVLKSLELSDQLYQMLPSGMKSPLSEKEILELLPDQIQNDEPKEVENIIINQIGIDFFNPERSPYKIVTLESLLYNQDEHDFLMIPTQYGREKILVRLNPYTLLLFLTGRISISEVIKCRMSDYYFVRDGDKYIRTRYNSYFNKLLDDLGLIDKFYTSLSESFRIENPIELYSYYVNNHTNSGKGIFEPGFRKNYPINIKIKNSK